MAVWGDHREMGVLEGIHSVTRVAGRVTGCGTPHFMVLSSANVEPGHVALVEPDSAQLGDGNKGLGPGNDLRQPCWHTVRHQPRIN